MLGSKIDPCEADLGIRLNDARSIKVFADLFENAISPWIIQIGSQDLLYIIIYCSANQP